MKSKIILYPKTILKWTSIKTPPAATDLIRGMNSYYKDYLLLVRQEIDLTQQERMLIRLGKINEPAPLTIICGTFNKSRMDQKAESGYWLPAHLIEIICYAEIPKLEAKDFLTPLTGVKSHD